MQKRDLLTICCMTVLVLILFLTIYTTNHTCELKDSNGNIVTARCDIIYAQTK